MPDNDAGAAPRRTGPKPVTVKIELPWEEAVARALRKPIPPEGVPDREKRNHKAPTANSRKRGG